MNRRHPLTLLSWLLMVVGLAGCQTAPKAPPYEPLVARFFVEAKPSEAGVVLVLPTSEIAITVNPKPVLVEYDIVNAEVARVELGACLLVQLSPAAARDFYRFSGSNQGRRLVLALNDAPVGARRIDGPVADGVVLVFVEVPDADLPELVNRLKRTSADILAAAAKKS